MQALSVLITLAVLGGLAWFAFRTEPHWVAKDGRAFTCRLQAIGDRGEPEGRWREARAFIDGDHLIVRPRGLMRTAPRSGHYRVLKRAEDPPKGKAIFLIDGEGVNGHEFAVLRIPASSRAVPHVEALVTRV